MESTSRSGPRMSRRLSRQGWRAFAATAVLAAVAATAGCGAVGSSASTSSGPLKIGLLAPVTGPVAADGIPLKRGFELAVKKVNHDGGVLGKPVQVFFQNDEADPATATQAAQKLINQDHVDFLFGTVTGDVALAVGKIANAAHVPFATAEMGSVSYCSPYIWPFGETNLMLLKPLVPEMVKRYGPNVALVGSDYVFPRQFNGQAKGLIAKAGGRVVDEEYSPLGTSDWQSVINRLGQAKPDWVLSAVVGGDAVAFVKQAQQFGLLDRAPVTGISLIQSYYPPLASIVDGSLLTGRYSDQLPTAENQAFVSAYRAAYGAQDGPIVSVAPNAYDGMRFIAKAVQQAGQTDPSTILEAMQKVHMRGIFGPDEHFTGNHVFQTPMHLQKIAAGGKYVSLRDYQSVSDPSPCR